MGLFVFSERCYCCCGVVDGGCPGPPIVLLLPNPPDWPNELPLEEPNELPLDWLKALPLVLPGCPFVPGCKAWPSCSCGWLGVLIRPPRSVVGSYANIHSLYLCLWLNSGIVESLLTLATPTIGPPPNTWPPP